MANKDIQMRLDEKLLDDLNKYSRQQSKTLTEFPDISYQVPVEASPYEI